MTYWVRFGGQLSWTLTLHKTIWRYDFLGRKENSTTCLVKVINTFLPHIIICRLFQIFNHLWHYIFITAHVIQSYLYWILFNNLSYVLHYVLNRCYSFSGTCEKMAVASCLQWLSHNILKCNSFSINSVLLHNMMLYSLLCCD